MSPLFFCAKFGSTLKLGVPVHDQSNWFAALLAGGVEEKTVAAIVGFVICSGGDQSGKKRLRSADFKSFGAGIDRNCRKHVINGHIIDFFAVASPMGRLAAIARDLPFSRPSTERHYVDFNPARLIRLVGNPLAIGRKL